MTFERSSIRARAAVGLVLAMTLGSAAARGQDPEAMAGPTEAPLVPASWLVLGPVKEALPAFHDRSAGGFGAEDLLVQPWLDTRELWPREGDSLRWTRGRALTWSRQGAPLELQGAQASPAVALAAVYLEVERFARGRLNLSTASLVEVHVDGAVVGGRKKASEEESFGVDLDLAPGKHLVLLKVVIPAGGEAPVRLEASLAARGGDDLGSLAFSTEHSRGLRLVDVLDSRAVTALDLSPDGAHLALTLRRPAAQPADGAETWLEVLRVADGELVRTLRGGEKGFAWAPDSRRFSYYTPSAGGPETSTSDLWVAELDGGRSRRLLQGVEGLSSVRWLPDGASLIYQLTEKGEADSRGVKRYRGLNDRWTDFRHRDYLYQVEVESGARRRLTSGPEDLTLLDVSPDGGRLLLSFNRYGPTRWPYTRDQVLELTLEDLGTREVAEVPWFGGAVYDRRGEGLLVLAGPSSFGTGGLPEEGLGEAVARGNAYDSQLYRLSLVDGEAEPLSRDFDPAIEGLAWSGDHLLARAQVGDRMEIFRWAPGSGTFVPLTSGLDRVEALDGDEAGRVLAYYGTSTSRSETVFIRSPATDGRPREVFRSTPGLEEDLRLGAVEPWSFVAEGGEIQGRIHYPPAFDPGQKYPLIVYYYGGTIPTDRNFADRYPFHVWTALGYVVYVPQPSGATGYGQEFSARHVNNWGRTVAAEILQGTEEVLAAHPFLDRRRVGCIGASYGGFMTMYLLTRSEIFAGAVAHAGISSISSYWGEGNWGYLYSAQASTSSFPWSHPDLYVGQSPLFSAEEITTPLLLLHGSADTNVPVGESQQMYTALEMLGKEVELITFDGEDHRIVQRDKRLLWSETILAWFAWRLKGQPEWWQHLYGGEDEPRG